MTCHLAASFGFITFEHDTLYLLSFVSLHNIPETPRSCRRSAGLHFITHEPRMKEPGNGEGEFPGQWLQSGQTRQGRTLGLLLEAQLRNRTVNQRISCPLVLHFMFGFGGFFLLYCFSIAGLKCINFLKEVQILLPDDLISHARECYAWVSLL